ncbi:hypothetical protein TNCV_2507671 [Trichonephila clavipes]|nr:hypothetical protein TNCV_2507671 [Trichonephila clavipes]
MSHVSRMRGRGKSLNIGYVKRGFTLGNSTPSLVLFVTDDLTDDFVNRNLECVSILLSSIWDSDFHGFGNLGLKRGVTSEEEVNGSAGGVGYGTIVDWRMAVSF